MDIKKISVQPSKSGGVEMYVTRKGGVIDKDSRFTFNADGELIREDSTKKELQEILEEIDDA